MTLAPILSLARRSTGAGRSRLAARRSHVFGFIWAVSWRQQLVLVALALGVAALELAPVELQRRIIDGAIVGESVSALVGLAGVYLGVIVLHQSVKHALRVYREAVAEDVMCTSRVRLFKMTGGADVDLNQDGAGTRVSVLGAEVQAIAKFAGSAFAELAVAGGTIVGLTTFMLVTEPGLALMCLPFLIPQVALVPLIQRRINALSEQRVDGRRELNDTVMEGEARAFRTTGWRLRTLGVETAWWKSLARIAVNLPNALAPLAVLFFGGLAVIAGDTSVGVVVAFISAFQRLADPTRDLLDYYRNAALTQTRYRLVGDWLCEAAVSQDDD